jgi:hypothetical protein
MENEFDKTNEKWRKIHLKIQFALLISNMRENGSFNCDFDLFAFSLLFGNVNAIKKDPISLELR